MENIVRKRLMLEDGNAFIGKAFFYMFLDLLLTAITAIGFSLFFKYVIKINPNAYVVVLFICLFALIGVSIWFGVSASKNSDHLVIPFVLYAIVMGVFCSSFTTWVSPATIGIALGVSCGAFGLMALLGAVIKKDINYLGLVALGMLMGAGLLALTNLIFFLCGLRQLVTPTYWLIEGIIFAAVMIITMVDVYNIKKIAERGDNSPNLALFCAFSLYTDFINIFLRVLSLIIRIRGN